MTRGKTNVSTNGNGRRKHANATAPTQHHRHNGKSKPILITGGAGFVGSNLAHRLLSAGHRVRLLDNLSRTGVERNLRWLIETHGDLVDIEVPDVRNLSIVKLAVKDASQVFHFAAQVAVTSSLVDPIEDFEINARGTLNLLEAIRAVENPPPLDFYFNEQSLRRPGRPRIHQRSYSLRASRRINSWPGSCRKQAARLSQSIRVLKGRGGSIRRRLRSHVSNSRTRISHELYLRATSVWQ